MVLRPVSICRRGVLAVGLCGGIFLTGASPVSAHTAFDIDEAAPGSIVTLNLLLENESETAGTTMVEIRFPEPLVIVDVPAVGCWTAEGVGGPLGSEAIGVMWMRPTAEPDEDPSLPLTIGPLPATEGPMTFKVLQTYSDGEEVAWIDEWAEGDPEPPHPAPILNLVAGAPGTIPADPDESVAEPSVAAVETTIEVTEISTLSAAAVSVAPAESFPVDTAPTACGESESAAGE